MREWGGIREGEVGCPQTDRWTTYTSSRAPLPRNQQAVREQTTPNELRYWSILYSSADTFSGVVIYRDIATPLNTFI